MSGIPERTIPRAQKLWYGIVIQDLQAHLSLRTIKGNNPILLDNPKGPARTHLAAGGNRDRIVLMA